MIYRFFILLIIVLSGCTDYSMTQSVTKGIKETIVEAKSDNSKTWKQHKNRHNRKVPQSVDSILSKNTIKKSENKKFSFSIKDMPAKTFFSGLVPGTQTNILKRSKSSS